jgi:hypothetical protein
LPDSELPAHASQVNYQASISVNIAILHASRGRIRPGWFARRLIGSYIIFETSTPMDSPLTSFAPETWPIYKSWSALAGYFDGDGTVEFSIHEFTLKVRLAFDENWKLHLEGLKRFLETRGIRCGAVRRKDGFNTWHVVVSNIDGVKLMADRMLPHLSKKRIEVKAVLDYYDDRITGDQFVDIMNRLVLAGERTGKHRGRGPNLTYSRGVLESRRMGEQKRVAKRTVILPTELAERIRSDRKNESLSLLELSRRYRYSIPVIKRALALA